MKKLVLLVAVLFPAVAGAETMTLKYDGYWEGIKAADITLKNVEDDDNYKVVTEVDTAGIVKTLTNFTSHTMTTGKIQKDQYLPNQYDSSWQTKKNSPHIVVSYGADGNVSENATPPENRSKHPEVEQIYKLSSFDPISVFFNARNQVRQIIESGQALPQKFPIKVFDARRVFMANFLIAGYVHKKIDGVDEKLLHIALNRSVVAGFNKKELEKIKSFNPTFDIYLDDNYIPVTGDGEAVIGHAEMRLVAKCLGENCS